MSISIEHITVRPELKGLVAKIWIFRSQGCLPADELKLIVPNGMFKLIIPVKNGVFGKYADWYHETKASKISLIGIADSPAYVDMLKDEAHINIGFEFTPIGAYRLFNLKQSELKNRIYDLEDIYGSSINEIENRIVDMQNEYKMVTFLQLFLVNRLKTSADDSLVNFCVKQIALAKGGIQISALEKMTGFSTRWLTEKFNEKIGLSPKSYASVVRFMTFYEKWAKNPQPKFFKADMYDFFFDQAHFIKDFKRFTGFSPYSYAKEENEFGRLFYKD